MNNTGRPTIFYERFNKISHRDAEKSGIKLLNLIQKDITVQLFQADALKALQNG